MGNVMINGFKVCPIFQANPGRDSWDPSQICQETCGSSQDCRIGDWHKYHQLTSKMKMWPAGNTEKSMKFLCETTWPPLKESGMISVANLTQLCAIVNAGWGLEMMVTTHLWWYIADGSIIGFTTLQEFYQRDHFWSCWKGSCPLTDSVGRSLCKGVVSHGLENNLQEMSC